MKACSYKSNIKAGLCSYLCGSVTFFLVCKTTICLGKYEGKKTTVKKMYENIGLLVLGGPLAPLFYIGLWGAFFNLFVTGGRIYPGTTRFQDKKNILLWPGLRYLALT